MMNRQKALFLPFILISQLLSPGWSALDRAAGLSGRAPRTCFVFAVLVLLMGCWGEVGGGGGAQPCCRSRLSLWRTYSVPWVWVQFWSAVHSLRAARPSPSLPHSRPFIAAEGSAPTFLSPLSSVFSHLHMQQRFDRLGRREQLCPALLEAHREG